MATDSHLVMHYGELPCVSTLFEFETVDQFHYVQRVLAELGLCKLNEKHLKPVRTKRA